MAKRITISFSNWIYEQYLQNANINRSKYIEEMFVKGINSELGEYQGVQAKAIDAIKKLREKEELIANLQRELASVKSRVMTQEKKRAEKEQNILNKAKARTMRKITMAQILEHDSKEGIL